MHAWELLGAVAASAQVTLMDGNGCKRDAMVCTKAVERIGERGDGFVDNTEDFAPRWNPYCLQKE